MDQTGRISSPADLRYQEDLLFPGRVIKEAGSVKVGSALHKVAKPSKLWQLKEIFPDEKFILIPGTSWTEMILEQNATGEDALRGWLVAAYAADIENSVPRSSIDVLKEAYVQMNHVFPPLLSQLQGKGWHTDQFIDGRGARFAF